MSGETPLCPQTAPYEVAVQEGKTYFWCSCGRSARQPFCDGSHKETGFTPQPYQAKKSGALFFCGCKQTKRTPLCDGSHQALKKSAAEKSAAGKA